jgi:uncharacterized membrane protein
MKKVEVMNLIKVMLRGGLLVLLPVLVFILLIKEVVELVVVIVTPLAEMLPAKFVDHVQFPFILALLLLGGVSLLIGIAMQSATARRMGNWMERQTLGRLSMYGFVKRLVTGLIDSDDVSAFKPAWLATDDDQMELAYVIEELPDGKAAVMVPWAPAAFSGSVRIVSRDRLRYIDASLGEASVVLNHMGVGAGKLIDRTRKV